MSNFIEQLFALEEGRVGDAIILQPKKTDSNGEPNFFGAQAIIQSHPFSDEETIRYCNSILYNSVHNAGRFRISS